MGSYLSRKTRLIGLNCEMHQVRKDRGTRMFCLDLIVQPVDIPSRGSEGGEIMKGLELVAIWTFKC